MPIIDMEPQASFGSDTTSPTIPCYSTCYLLLATCYVVLASEIRDSRIRFFLSISPPDSPRFPLATGASIRARPSGALARSKTKGHLL